jgi:cell division protein FtsB
MTFSHDTDDSVPASPSGWIVSLSFWLCLITAAAIYALVALAPRYLTYLHLHRQFHENQLQLVALERQTRRLEQITTSLRNDPAFARELARMDFRTAKPDEQRIPVDAELSLSIRPSGPELEVPPPPLPWFAPLLQLLVENRGVGDALLYLSAGRSGPSRTTGAIGTDDTSLDLPVPDPHLFHRESHASAR